jgi:broad specificity phosphatase PhoE
MDIESNTSNQYVIKLVRHGQSTANENRPTNGDYADSQIALTNLGWDQARTAGEQLGRSFISNSLVCCSPYKRTRQTFNGLLEGAQCVGGAKYYEDPRLREVDHGYNDFGAQKELQDLHGRFFYRLDGGESPADCYDRISTFLESLTRNVRDYGFRNVLVVSHGLTIRCFVMRFLHLTVEQFEDMKNPLNASIITIGPRSLISNPVFTSNRWAVDGLERRSNEH